MKNNFTISQRNAIVEKHLWCIKAVMKQNRALIRAAKLDTDIGDGQLGTFLHHVAQRTGDGDLAAAIVHDLHLDGQGLASDAGPGQTVGNTDGIGPVEEIGLDEAGAQQLFQAAAGHRNVFCFAGRDLAGTLAQDTGDSTLQGADTGLTGVAVNDAVEPSSSSGQVMFNS